MIEYHYSNNCLKDTLEDLKLFKQTNYCYSYIKNKFPNIDDKLICENSDIASACFRQANEFLLSATTVSLNTSPLLYSYALNNFAKGMGYLFYIDDKILENFRKHGFNIEKENISQNLLNTKISIQQFGVTTFLLKAFENFELTPQDISFELLLSQIPELEKAFAKTTLHMPNVAQKSINENYDFVMECPYYEEDKGEIFEEYGIVGTYNKKYSKLCCYFNIKGKDKYFNNENLNNNLFYKDYIILPNKFVDGIHDINLIYYCYLTIMGYGMLVRYNSNKWEKFIDPKISNESSLIEMSINTCVNHFLILLHQKILGYTYIEERYDDKKVIKVIKESTPLIMKEINKNIERRNLVFNSKTPLPWPNSQEVVY